MSVGSFFSDVLHGNLSHAYSRLADWYQCWPAPLKAFVASLTDDEGQILMAAAETALAGALAGQSITQIADDLWPILETQVPNKAKNDLLNALGVLIHAPSAPTTLAVS